MDMGMVPTVAGQLGPLIDDATDQPGMALGDPAEHEESALRAAFGEQVEKGGGVQLDTARQAVPVLARHGAGEGMDLVIVFDVDGERVALRRLANPVAACRIAGLRDRKSTRLNSSQ